MSRAGSPSSKSGGWGAGQAVVPMKAKLPGLHARDVERAAGHEQLGPLASGQVGADGPHLALAIGVEQQHFQRIAQIVGGTSGPRAGGVAPCAARQVRRESESADASEREPP